MTAWPRTGLLAPAGPVCVCVCGRLFTLDDTGLSTLDVRLHLTPSSSSSATPTAANIGRDKCLSTCRGLCCQPCGDFACECHTQLPPVQLLCLVAGVDFGCYAPEPLQISAPMTARCPSEATIKLFNLPKYISPLPNTSLGYRV